MKFYQETTEWRGGGVNHVYLLSDNRTKMFAYVQHGTDRVIEFKRPIDFDIRGRKFKEVANTFNYTVKREKPTNPHWEVVGSKGDVYIVEFDNGRYKCSCVGFKFKHKCSHIEKVAK